MVAHITENKMTNEDYIDEKSYEDVLEKVIKIAEAANNDAFEIEGDGNHEYGTIFLIEEYPFPGHVFEFGESADANIYFSSVKFNLLSKPHYLTKFEVKLAGSNNNERVWPTECLSESQELETAIGEAILKLNDEVGHPADNYSTEVREFHNVTKYALETVYSALTEEE